jgi:uncharacterized protein YqeY
MSTLKERLQQDLTAAIKSRDAVSADTIRMALTAITNEEVAGKAHRELTDADVVDVLSREAKRRREAATAYDDAGRAELAARELAQLDVIGRYLPTPLTDEELRAIVEAAVAEVSASGVTGGAAMGAVMKAVQPSTKGRADGAAVSALVRSALGT